MKQRRTLEIVLYIVVHDQRGSSGRVLRICVGSSHACRHVDQVNIDPDAVSDPQIRIRLSIASSSGRVGVP
jgi:hypothetical protein